MARPMQQAAVINLISDSEDDSSLDLGQRHGAEDVYDGAFEFLDDFPDNILDVEGPFTADDRNTIDLTALPDVDVPPVPLAEGDRAPANPNATLADVELITEAQCLQMVLDVLPDISIEHVLNLIQEQTQQHTRTHAACEQILTQLLDGGAYPKEQDEETSRKRKRQNSSSEFEDGDANVDMPRYQKDALDLLKDEFLEVPVRHLENVMGEHKTLGKAYSVIEEQLRNYQTTARHTFRKISKGRNKRGAEPILVERGSSLPKELRAAKQKSERDAGKRLKAEKEQRAEEDNIRQAQINGEMGECLCCFDDFPLNRMTSCGGEDVHFFCLPCAKKYVEGEMGSGRCKPVCFADSNCGGTFTRYQLQQFLGDISFERLEHLQQQHDLAAAGLDFLSECPFCDYKAECPPVEEDKEFRCMNPKCRKTSCRHCLKETHIPLSCEEAKKDEKLTVRHVVEEAMSAALIRHCNKCRHPFVKEYGCNKMTCSHCKNVQCYVCSKDVRDYKHFGDGRGDIRGAQSCPLHDNVEDRHEIEVKRAAEEAMAKVRQENPDLSEADLMVKVSDRVKKAEQERQGRAQAAHNGFPFHMANGALINGQANPMEVRINPAPPVQYVPVQPVRVAPLQYVQHVQHFPPLHFHQHFVHPPHAPPQNPVYNDLHINHAPPAGACQHQQNGFPLGFAQGPIHMLGRLAGLQPVAPQQHVYAPQGLVQPQMQLQPVDALPGAAPPGGQMHRHAVPVPPVAPGPPQVPIPPPAPDFFARGWFG